MSNFSGIYNAIIGSSVYPPQCCQYWGPTIKGKCLILHMYHRHDGGSVQQCGRTGGGDAALIDNVPRVRNFCDG